MRLMRALRDQGIDARMVVMRKESDSPYVDEAGPRWLGKACFLAEHARIYMANHHNRKTLFQVSLANCGLPLSRHPWVRGADIVVLGWVNQGMISMKEIMRIKAPVVWVMHDMWCFTGICHHAGDCGRYMSICGSCPKLFNNASGENIVKKDLSTATMRRKEELYRAKRMRFVAVSNWLAEKSRSACVMRGQEVSCIPNVFHLEDFRIGRKPGNTVIMGAARLDDPIKRFDLAIEALNLLPGIKAIFFGALKDESILDRLKIDYEWLGPISDQKKIADLYAAADVVLSSSSYETLPGTLIEGMAGGCVPVAFGQGGQADIVEHMGTGYIAEYPSAADLSAGISWALSSGLDPARLRKRVEDKFAAPAIAKRYIELFGGILDNSKDA